MVGMVVEGSAKEVVDACRDMGLLCCVVASTSCVSPAAEHQRKRFGRGAQV